MYFLGHPYAVIEAGKEKDFVFDKLEVDKFVCKAYSYPAPREIDISIDHKRKISENTPGVSIMIRDLDSQIREHTVSFIAEVSGSLSCLLITR